MYDDLNSELLDTATDLLEAAGDQLLQEGILRDVPLIGTVVRIARAVGTISDRIFLLKVKKFIFSLSKLSDVEKDDFSEQMDKDEKLRSKVGETVVLLLDRSDDLEKVEILAKIFSAYIKNRITFDQFHRLSVAVDLAYIGDLKLFYTSNGENLDNCYRDLVRTGLINTFSQGLVFGRSEFYEVTEIGNLFVKILNDEL